MSTQDLVTGYGNYGVTPREMVAEPILLRRYVDFSKTPITSGYTVYVLAYPANTLIQYAAIVTAVADGGGNLVDLFDDASKTTNLAADLDMNTPGTVVAYTAGAKFKASAGYLCLCPDQTSSTGAIWVVALLQPLTTKD